MVWIALFGTIGYLKPSIKITIERLITILLILVGFSMMITGIKAIT